MLPAAPAAFPRLPVTSGVVGHWSNRGIVPRAADKTEVSGWRDSSGANDFFRDPGEFFPQLAPTQNGHVTVSFATSEGLRLEQTDVQDGDPGEAFFAWRSNSVPAAINSAYQFCGVAAVTKSLYTFSDDLIYDFFAGDARRSFSQNPAGVVRTWHIYHAIGELGLNQFRINGVNQFTSTTNTALNWRSGPTEPWFLGFSLVGGIRRVFDGQMGEFVVYSPTLSTADRDSVLTYLSDKWT